MMDMVLCVKQEAPNVLSGPLVYPLSGFMVVETLLACQLVRWIIKKRWGRKKGGGGRREGGKIRQQVVGRDNYCLQNILFSEPLVYLCCG